MTVTGVDATIRWTYYDAAKINSYSITRDESTREWFVTGHIILADAFKLSQTPLMLIVPHKRGRWEWPIRSPIPRRAGPFAATLGNPIERLNVCRSASAGPKPSALIYHPAIGSSFENS